MVRFLLTCAFFLFLYLAFDAVSDYNFALDFTFLDYSVNTTIFTFIIFFILLQISLLILIKFISLFFGIPGFFMDKIRERRMSKISMNMISIFIKILSNNKNTALHSIKKIFATLPKKEQKQNKDFIKFIESKISNDSSEQINYLKDLVNKKEYSFYAAKKLAEIYFKLEEYKSAEKYAVQAFNENDTDVSLMLSLIHIYNKLNLYSKIVFIVSKIKRCNLNFLTLHSKEIAACYFEIANKITSDKEINDDEAVYYLELALELEPDNLDSLSLLTELQINNNNTKAALNLLRSAFKVTPCFEVARMFVSIHKGSNEEIYKELSSISDHKKYKDVFLAIAAYLELNEKIEQIKAYYA